MPLIHEMMDHEKRALNRLLEIIDDYMYDARDSDMEDPHVSLYGLSGWIHATMYPEYNRGRRNNFPQPIDIAPLREDSKELNKIKQGNPEYIDW